MLKLGWGTPTLVSATIGVLVSSTSVVVVGRAAITLVNYASAGPIISGPHEQPYICDTERFHMPAGEKLGAALDADCSLATRVDYYYRAAGTDKLKPLVDPATGTGNSPPA